MSVPTVEPMAQGDMTQITDPDSVEYKRDVIGFTHPNLHKRMDSENDIYTIRVHGLNAYRYEDTSTHDEESETSEIP